jgi:hypothetical protein
MNYICPKTGLELRPTQVGVAYTGEPLNDILKDGIKLAWGFRDESPDKQIQRAIRVNEHSAYTEMVTTAHAANKATQEYIQWHDLALKADA